MPDNPAARPIYKEVIHAARLGLVVNLILGAVKLVVGLSTQAFSLVADAVNSLGDVVSTLVILFALHLAQRPPDKEHPYGHSRAEGVAATNVALLVMISALWIGGQAVTRLFHPVEGPSPPIWTLGIAAANILIKEGLFHYKMRVGRRTGSAAIMANAWDHRSDAFCSLAVLVGLATVQFGGPEFAWADPLASLVVVVAILWSAGLLFRRSGSDLMDSQADAGLIRDMRKEALSVEGVKDVETLWVRKSGLEYLADIHIEVLASMTVAEGHEIGHRVKDHLLQTFPPLRDVLVHLEPHEPGAGSHPAG